VTCCHCQLPIDPAESGIRYFGLSIAHAEYRCHQLLRLEIETLQRKLNTPELHNFRDAVVLEAAHQRERWGSNHDAGKEPSDWFWLLGYLSGKALRSHIAGDLDKALHHTISSAAALANWHAQMLGQTDMRPGLSSEKQRLIETGSESAAECRI
jgi:hypothetical protein